MLSRSYTAHSILENQKDPRAIGQVSNSAVTSYTTPEFLHTWNTYTLSTPTR